MCYIRYWPLGGSLPPNGALPNGSKGNPAQTRKVTVMTTAIQTDPATDTSPDATDQTATDRQPAKTTRKPRTAKPAAPPTLAELEAQAAGYVTAGNTAGMSLASVLVELYQRTGWTEHEQSIVDYFTLTIGVGESGFTLPKLARQEVVKLMASQAPDCAIAHLAIITGASLRTISRDREQWELANPNRVNSHKPTPDDDATDDNAGDDDATDDAKPAKASKTRVNTVNVLAIIDELQDATYLMNVITHASARLTALNTPATDKVAA